MARDAIVIPFVLRMAIFAAGVVVLLREAALLPLRLFVGQLPLPGDGLRMGLVTVGPRHT